MDKKTGKPKTTNALKRSSAKPYKRPGKRANDTTKEDLTDMGNGLTAKEQTEFSLLFSEKSSTIVRETAIFDNEEKVKAAEDVIQQLINNMHTASETNSRFAPRIVGNALRWIEQNTNKESGHLPFKVSGLTFSLTEDIILPLGVLTHFIIFQQAVKLTKQQKAVPDHVLSFIIGSKPITM